MSDHFSFDPWKSIQSDSGLWYEAVEHLASGKNAVVFLVHGKSAQNSGLFFAMKVFRRISTPEAKNKFLQETAFLTQISHPAVVKIYDQGTYYDNHPFVVADYLPQTLRHVINGGAPLIEKISYALQLTAAVKFINQLNPQVIHRDIKPENIFIKGKSCVLGDFGLMKRGENDDELEREIIKTSSGPGMPLKYRTPELIRYFKGEKVMIGRSDIFQLGLTLAELFAGRNPQRVAGDYGEPLQMEKVGRIDGNLGGGIANLISRMLAEEPDKRPDWTWQLDVWKEILHEAVDTAHHLGRAF
jgi:serine/threonine protein kinase